MPRTALLLLLSLPLGVAAHAADLTVDGTTVTLNGSLTYDNVRVINGGVITVTDYTGSGTTGTLSITAETITVDSSSAIIADGAGYRGVLNGNVRAWGGGACPSWTRAAARPRRPRRPRTTPAARTRARVARPMAPPLDDGGWARLAGRPARTGTPAVAGRGRGHPLTAQTITIAGTIRTNGDSGGVINNDAAGAARGAASSSRWTCWPVWAPSSPTAATGRHGRRRRRRRRRRHQPVLRRLGHHLYGHRERGDEPSCGGTSGSSGATGAAELDWDGDGYTASDGDCDTDDASVFPAPPVPRRGRQRLRRDHRRVRRRGRGHLRRQRRGRLRLGHRRGRRRLQRAVGLRRQHRL